MNEKLVTILYAKPYEMKQVHSFKKIIKIQVYGTVNWRINWFKTLYFEIMIDLQEFEKKKKKEQKPKEESCSSFSVVNFYFVEGLDYDLPICKDP